MSENSPGKGESQTTEEGRGSVSLGYTASVRPERKKKKGSKARGERSGRAIKRDDIG